MGREVEPVLTELSITLICKLEPIYNSSQHFFSTDWSLVHRLNTIDEIYFWLDILSDESRI